MVSQWEQTVVPWAKVLCLFEPTCPPQPTPSTDLSSLNSFPFASSFAPVLITLDIRETRNVNASHNYFPVGIHGWRSQTSSSKISVFCCNKHVFLLETLPWFHPLKRSLELQSSAGHPSCMQLQHLTLTSRFDIQVINM